LEVENRSTYVINFEFRWTPSSSWISYTETPGQYELFWTDYSTSLTPQVFYNTTTSSGSQTTCSLAQGYNEWFGIGTPPTSAATLYQFENTATGLDIDYVPPPPTDAVIEVQNNSDWTITFSFRWTPTSNWTAYTESPGQNEILWNTDSTGLTPQVLYNTTASPDSQTTVNLVQGYGEWTGTGTPPESAATPYEFLNDSTGVELDYWSPSPTPTPTPTPSPTPTPTPVPTPIPTPTPTPPPIPQPTLPPTTSPNWSGYVAATNLSEPQPNSVSAVYGSWTVPTVTGQSRRTNDFSSIWIGIDGWNSSTVEQVGTLETVFKGKAYYYAFWEMYSTGIGQPNQIIANMEVNPGDSITASVQYIASGLHADQFDLSIVDNSRPNDSFSTYQSSFQTQNPLAQRESAEWIVEASTLAGTIQTPPRFSQVTFSNASAVINGVSGPINASSWQSQAVNMAANGVNYDTTSGLPGSGSSFAVTYDSSALSPIRRGSKHHGKRPHHAAFGRTHRSYERASGQIVNAPGRNGNLAAPGFRTQVHQYKRFSQRTLFGPLGD
jgi:hypothetical protein